MQMLWRVVMASVIAPKAQIRQEKAASDSPARAFRATHRAG
jgi:hypothetical protein